MISSVRRKYVLILLVVFMIHACLQGGFVQEEDFETCYHCTKMLLSVNRGEVEKELTNVTPMCDARSPENLGSYAIVALPAYLNFYLCFTCISAFFSSVREIHAKSTALLK